MRKIFLTTSMAMLGMSLFAQTINFNNGAVTYSFPASLAGTMPFTGNNVTVADRTFALPEWPSINVDDTTVKDNTVEVDYSQTGATVRIAGNIAKYIEATVKGEHVDLTQSDEVSAENCGEITYVLKGESSDGSLTMNGSYKATI
ncbi:MAG: hypothetical protein K2L00_03925, partial [Muribaculaceae bacterium]|nr:hypothetical protein [Muribaculaceae bacterium]